MLSNKQMHQRTIKLAVFGIVLIAMVTLSLGLVTGTSEAQGPGRGRGNSGGSAGFGPGVDQGSVLGDNLRQQDRLADGSCDGTGECLADQLGYGYGAGWRGANNQARMGGGILVDLPPATPGELPADVIAALEAGIMDEYHAYATYAAVIEQFGAVRPFTNIINSERMHIDALAFLFERYGLDVPQAPVVDTPQFASVQDACAAAVAAEVANFGLYDQWLATVQAYPDLVQVFQALRDASEFQHLPAFEICAG